MIFLTVTDCFDVPMYEKPIALEGFKAGIKNDTNVVYLNDGLNI